MRNEIAAVRRGRGVERAAEEISRDARARQSQPAGGWRQAQGREFTIPVASNGTGIVTEAVLFALSWGWMPARRSGGQQAPARIFEGSLHFGGWV